MGISVPFVSLLWAYRMESPDFPCQFSQMQLFGYIMDWYPSMVISVVCYINSIITTYSGSAFRIPMHFDCGFNKIKGFI